MSETEQKAGEENRGHLTSLPVHLAFVVQFRGDCEANLEPFHGRVEHVTSGAPKSFQSLEDLRQFFCSVAGSTSSGDARDLTRQTNINEPSSR